MSFRKRSQECCIPCLATTPQRPFASRQTTLRELDGAPGIRCAICRRACPAEPAQRSEDNPVATLVTQLASAVQVGAAESLQPVPRYRGTRTCFRRSPTGVRALAIPRTRGQASDDGTCTAFARTALPFIWTSPAGPPDRGWVGPSCMRVCCPSVRKIHTVGSSTCPTEPLAAR